MAGPPRLEQSAKLNIVVIIFKKIRRRPVARQQKGESVERKRGAKHIVSVILIAKQFLETYVYLLK